jgi:hypothetical protein
MQYPRTNTRLQRRQSQSLQIMGINKTDNYVSGQLESSKGITADNYPYISTSGRKIPVDLGLPSGATPISIYAWEKLFVVTDEPSETGGYKCYYGGKYCGDAVNTTAPKQYAVLNSKLVMFPDKVYFSLYDNEMTSHPLTTAPLLLSVGEGSAQMRRKVVT